MTGHIPGATVLRNQGEQPAQGPGTNHVALRADNERIVLSLIRMHGSLSKAQLAELSGLTAQTASVISKSLIDAGLLLAGTPVRGKVGQPYVPLSLNPAGASFLGLHLGNEGVHAAHVNFVGETIFSSVADDFRSASDLVSFAEKLIGRIRDDVEFGSRGRFQGIGISVANNLFGKNSRLQKSALDDAVFELQRRFDVTVQVANDVMAACSAELVYGLGASVPDFLYVYLDQMAHGGLVQNRRIRFSQDGVVPNLGKTVVPVGKSRFAALDSLRISDGDNLEEINRLADGLAFASVNCAALIGCRTIVVDGPIQDHRLRLIIARLRRTLSKFGTDDSSAIITREGSMMRKTAAMSAACLPLLERFYPDE